jgi:hypothetical protein
MIIAGVNTSFNIQGTIMRLLSKQLALIVALCFSGAASAAPTVTNGSFDGNADGWTLSGGCAAAGYVADGNGGGAVGMNSCGEADTDPSVGQTVTGLNIGQTYTLGWDQRLWENYSGAGFGNSFGVFLGADGGTALLTNEYLGTTWKTMTATFVASATSQLITFASELDQRTAGVVLRTDVSYALDNVTLAEVPEPASLAMVGLGLGLAGMFARRRKQA